VERQGLAVADPLRGGLGGEGRQNLEPFGGGFEAGVQGDY